MSLRPIYINLLKELKTDSIIYNTSFRNFFWSSGFLVAKLIAWKSENNTDDGNSPIKQISGKEYLQTCFDYIHNNPAKAGLVKNPEDWEFSSCRDYYGLRNGTLVNLSRANEFGLR